MKSVDDCNMATNACSSNGNCAPDASNNFNCICDPQYLGANCSENFFEVYQGSYAFYYIFGFIFYPVCLILFSFEVVSEIKSGKTSRILLPSKICGIMSCLLRIGHYVIETISSQNGDLFHPKWLDGIFYNFGSISGFAMYMLMLVQWIDLFTKTKVLSLDKSMSKLFLKARKVIFVALIVYSILATIFLCFYLVGIFSTVAILLYEGINAIYILTFVILTSIYCVKMHFLITSSQAGTAAEKLMLTKNIIIGVIAIAWFLYVITIGYFTFVQSDPWPYLISLFLFSVWEVVILCLAIAFMQKYLEKKRLQKLWCSTGNLSEPTPIDE